MSYRYQLEKYSGKKSRFRCPSCGSENDFTRYVDTMTNEYLHPEVGICNRKSKCYYHYPPKKYFKDYSLIKLDEYHNKSNFKYKSQVFETCREQMNLTSDNVPNEKTDYVDSSLNNVEKTCFTGIDYVERSNKKSFNTVDIYNVKSNTYVSGNGTSCVDLNHYNVAHFRRSNFYKGLMKFAFSNNDMRKIHNVLNTYKVCSYNDKKRKNWVAFWQIDTKGQVRTGKLFQYDLRNLKRKSQHWFHSLHEKKDFKLKQVPFGLHLLNYYKSKKIGIVESEKTAIIMSLAKPEILWLAVGGCNNLNSKMLSDIKSRSICLFPDAGKYDLWQGKMNDLPKTNIYEMSSLLENISSPYEKEEDFDLADYVLNIWNEEVV